MKEMSIVTYEFAGTHKAFLKVAGVEGGIIGSGCTVQEAMAAAFGVFSESYLNMAGVEWPPRGGCGR